MTADAAVLPYWPDRPPGEAAEIAVTADELGYPELWVGEMATYDAFALSAALATQTRSIALCIGPLAVHVRSPAAMALGVASLAELTSRSVRLALGTSSPAVVGWHGRGREHPAATLEAAAVEVRRVLRGERAATGFRLRLPAVEAHLTIAATGPKAVDVAARLADRMLLNLVTVEAVARLRGALDDAAAAAGRPPPPLAAWLPAAVDPTPDDEAQLARGLVAYLAAPGYGEVFTEAGFGELVAAARSGASPRDLFASTPTALARAVGLVGTPAEVAERIAAYRAAGLDQVAVVPATASDPAGRRTLTALAP